MSFAGELRDCGNRQKPSTAALLAKRPRRYRPHMEALVSLPTAADVDEAARRLAGVALRTPLLTSAALDAMTGGRVFLKAETLQHTGSFKFRGAYNKLAAIPPDSGPAGVVAFSSGNHAQGVAAAARLLGMPCVIVMPHDAPRAKRERTAALGAEIVLYDRARDDREAIAERDRGAPRRGAGSALRRRADHRRPGHRRPGDRRGFERARTYAGRRRGDRIRRRAHCRHRARGAGRGCRRPRSIPPSRRASTTMRARFAAAGASKTPR